MRGTLPETYHDTDQSGIIPAYAGNTMIVPVAHVHWWDHPRVCGEHYHAGSLGDRQPGSSPRMRGTLCYGLIGGV